MGITYRWVDWQFDTGRWAVEVKNAVNLYGIDDVAELMDMTPQGITGWMEGRHHKDYPYPRMTNFMNFCSTFNLSPAAFFWVGEG